VTDRHHNIIDWCVSAEKTTRQTTREGGDAGRSQTEARSTASRGRAAQQIGVARDEEASSAISHRRQGSQES